MEGNVNNNIIINTINIYEVIIFNRSVLTF